MLMRAHSDRARNGRVLFSHSLRHGKRRRSGASHAATIIWRIAAHGSHPGEPHGLLAIMWRWERFARRHWPLHAIPGAAFGLLSFRFEPYDGPPVTLPDGTEIRPGDSIGELHCNNLAILRLVECGQNPYAAARKDLARMNAWLEQIDPAEKIPALHGITMLAPAARRLGFFVRELPHGVKAQLERFFMIGLLLIYTTDGITRLENGTTVRMYPREVWLTRRQMRVRYATRGDFPRAAEAPHDGAPPGY
jgi:hypothetical protein